MFSVCTRHQSQQNGFLSLLGPLSVFSFAPISAVDRLMVFVLTKKRQCPPLFEEVTGCSHTYMDAGVHAGCVPHGGDGAAVLDVKGYTEWSVCTNV